MKAKQITAEQRELIRTDEILQERIAKEIGLSANTIYGWALYRPERFEHSAAAMRIIERYKPKKATA